MLVVRSSILQPQSYISQFTTTTETMATQETEWKDLDLGECLEVIKYLGQDVDAVTLPEKVSQDPIYPDLILDGASGVGKTQQAY
jgi:hypothetical protein